MKSTLPRRKSGFTLIELLIVVAIIGLLAAILFPVFARARENARRASCSSNLKQIGLGIMQYTQDYDEKLPLLGGGYGGGYGGGGAYINADGIAMDASLLIQPYVKSMQVLVCPSDRYSVIFDLPVYGNRVRRSYGMPQYLRVFDTSGNGTGPSKSLAAIPNPSLTALAGERRGCGSGGSTVGEWDYCSEFAFGEDVANVSAFATWFTSATDCVHLKTVNFLFVDGHVKATTGSKSNRPRLTGHSDFGTVAGSFFTNDSALPQ